jgi:hypothetical protein
MKYAYVAINDEQQIKKLEDSISEWVTHIPRNTRRTDDHKYWKALQSYPCSDKNEYFYILLRYLQIIEENDSLFDLSSGFQITELELRNKEIPGIIKQCLKNINQKLKNRLIEKHPILGRILVFLFSERTPLIRNFS